MISPAVFFFFIAGLFGVLVLLRLHWSICALCASVSITWILGSLLFWRGVVVDPLIIGVLMGQSIVGFLYLLEKKLPEELHLFRLPFLLTGTWLIYSVLRPGAVMIEVIWLLVGLWGFAALLYGLRHHQRMQIMMRRLVECCRNW